MNTENQIQEFYSSTLLVDLKQHEQNRNKLLRGFFYSGIIILCLLAILFIIFSNTILANPPLGVTLFAAIILTCGIIIYLFIRDFIRKFKQDIIQKIVHFVDKNLSVSTTKYIQKSTFMASKIFKMEPNGYIMDNFVSGKINSTNAIFCEIDTKHPKIPGKKSVDGVIFKGFFCVCDGKKGFEGQTVVLPDTMEKLFGDIGQTLQWWNNSRRSHVKFKNQEFKKNFYVYSDDHLEATQLLTKSLTNRIVDFKKRTGRNVYLSFVGSNVFIAISYKKDLFKPTILSTLITLEPVSEYIEDLHLAFGIIKDLKTNKWL